LIGQKIERTFAREEKQMAEIVKSDTLIIEDKAMLSLNHLTRNLDPKLNYEPYFWTMFDSDPVEARHDFPDFGDITGRYLDALILMRRMTGSETGELEEQKLKELLLSYFSEGDGLNYRPNTAWSKHDALMFDQSSVLSALVTWYIKTKEEKVKHYLERMIEGLWKIAIKKEGYCFYPYEVYAPTGWDWNYNGGEGATNRASDSCYDGGRMILPLVIYFELTGYERALVLAKNLVDGNLYHSTSSSHEGPIFSEDGSFTYGHFHSRTAVIAGILRYGIATGEKKYAEWAERAYNWTKTQGSSYGWFPVNDEEESCETCCLADMLETAIMLAENGRPKYWSDIEIFTRNHLAESQLDDISWVKSRDKRPDTQQSSFDNIPERARGGFAGWSGPNDFFGPSVQPFKYRLQNCCSAAGARALFLVWHHIVTKKEKGVFVNMSLDRDTEWVEVKSLRPNKGEVKVKVHNAPTLFLRVPDWADRDQVTLTVDGNKRETDWIDNNYLKLVGLEKNQEATVIYPLTEKEENETIGTKNFRVEWKGDTVMSITPPGVKVPLYQKRKS